MLRSVFLFAIALTIRVSAATIESAAFTSSPAVEACHRATLTEEQKKSVLIWANLTLGDIDAGGKLRIEVLDPTGQLVTTIAMTIYPADDVRCFEGPVLSKGGLPSLSPGTWTVRVFWDDALAGERTLPIGANGSLPVTLLPSLPPVLPVVPPGLPELIALAPPPGTRPTLPTNPGTPAVPAVPTIPTVPGLPVVILPNLPNLPNLPTEPTIPTNPVIPTIPAIPTIPGISLPSLPTIPGLPIPIIPGPVLPIPPKKPTSTERVMAFTPEPGCNFNVWPLQVEVAPSGQSVKIRVNASDDACRWIASADLVPWAVPGRDGGYGSGEFEIEILGNTGGVRSLSLEVAGQSVAITQDAVATIAPLVRRVSNAASNFPLDWPSGALALGGVFSIYGEALGPVRGVMASSLPLAKALAGTSIQIRQGDTVVDAYPVYVSNKQVNAVLSAKSPTGDAQLVVRYNGLVSATFQVRIAQYGPGLFAKASGAGIVRNFVPEGDLQVNSALASAKPGQAVILWGTGLGPVASETETDSEVSLSSDIEALVGGVPARVVYQGRSTGIDQIILEVPANAPTGCNVPTQVSVGSLYTNVVGISIDADGKACNTTTGDAVGSASDGGRIGRVLLVRGGSSGGGLAGLLSADAAMGTFQVLRPGSSDSFQPLETLPPVGTCQVFTTDGQQPTTPGVPVWALPIYSERGLDAGARLTLTSPSGRNNSMPRYGGPAGGNYFGLFSASISGFRFGSSVETGVFTAKGFGGADVGPFTVSANLPPSVQWTNANAISSVERAAGVLLKWTGGNSQQAIVISGVSQGVGHEQGVFYCVADAAAGSFQVPASVLSVLPASRSGILDLAVLPASGPVKFSATGIDSGFFITTSVTAKTVSYR